AVQRVAERGNGLRAVRPERGGLEEDLAGLGEQPLAVERAAHGKHEVEVLGAAGAARLLEEAERLVVAAQPQHDLAEADQGVLMVGVEDERLLERLLGPREL